MMKDGLSVTAGLAEDGMTARGVLVRAKGVSQRLIRKIKYGEGETAGALYVNGRTARFKDKVKAGDEIRLVFPGDESRFEPQDIELSVLYEDDDLLVIDKQPGIVVHPTRGHREGTIANAVTFYMKERGEKYIPRFVSRLDMNTSGVLLIGKNSHIQDSLAKQGKAGNVEKIYIAVLEGRLEDDLPASGIIDLPIGLPDTEDPRRAAMAEDEGGYPSQTEYEVIDPRHAVMAEGEGGYPSQTVHEMIDPRRAFMLDGKGVYPSQAAYDEEMSCGAQEDGQDNENRHFCLTVVRIRLLTGRTHQIRVHFSHYGHPVLGDELYGRPAPLIGRQALHAAEFAFAHPVDGRPVCIKAPLPADMARVISLL